MKRVDALQVVITYSRTAYAMASPSFVEVPLPSSSRTIRERGEAALMISQVSVNSTMNVCQANQYKTCK